MKKNSMKQKLENNELTLGAFVSTPSPSTVEMLGWLGMDYVMIDCEHSVTDYETAENMIRAAELSNITPMVRAGLNMQQNLQRYLDAGAQGVLIPLINNAEDGKRVVDSCKYPPDGKRGLFSASRTGKYGTISIPEHVKTSNEEIFVALQIETLEGIENQDEIISLDGVDSVFLGPGDLSSVLGVHGEVTHEKVRSTMEQMIPKIIEAGKHPGTLVADADQAKYWNDKGINFLIGSANRYLMNGAKEFIETTQKILRS
ncbi:MAG: HpcH/HpaI aldolase family protein [Dehalococcoidia bacterium]|tara:strand:+ start:312 stop:1085 length:774 start_codon:yes stop_codon:yes gene_type:complete